MYIYNIQGNKGGVGIRFNLYDSSFCVINSHLNAHQDGVQR
jgi:phosphatidylinositol-bisphosphatase